MNFGRIIRIVFFSFVFSIFQNTPKAYLTLSLETAEQVSVLVALPAIFVERFCENSRGPGSKEMSKVSKVCVDIARLLNGALTLKNQHDCDARMRLQKYTALWFLIDSVKLGVDILPERFLERLIALFPDEAFNKFDNAWLTEFEKTFHAFFEKNALKIRAFLPDIEMVAMTSSVYTQSQKTKFYVSGVKGLFRSFDEYLGAKNETVRRLFLILFVAHLVSLIGDGVLPPVFEEKNKKALVAQGLVKKELEKKELEEKNAKEIKQKQEAPKPKQLDEKKKEELKIEPKKTQETLAPKTSFWGGVKNFLNDYGKELGTVDEQEEIELQQPQLETVLSNKESEKKEEPKKIELVKIDEPKKIEPEKAQEKKLEVTPKIVTRGWLGTKYDQAKEKISNSFWDLGWSLFGR